MDKEITATYDGEVLRPDEPVDWAPNTKVRVISEVPSKKLELKYVKKKKPPGEPYGLFKYLSSLKLQGPSDWSANVDEYLYHGKPFPDDE